MRFRRSEQGDRRGAGRRAGNVRRPAVPSLDRFRPVPAHASPCQPPAQPLSVRLCAVPARASNGRQTNGGEREHDRAHRKKFATPPTRSRLGPPMLPRANGRAGKIFPRTPTPFFAKGGMAKKCDGDFGSPPMECRSMGRQACCGTGNENRRTRT